jgi:hypothetical protein
MVTGKAGSQAAKTVITSQRVARNARPLTGSTKQSSDMDLTDYFVTCYTPERREPLPA